ncbi:MAG TPA: endonuclease/exonuclease/phosphatase family protein [Micromonosporaceae bacterium]|nr:endonuclease/exonuclease/phosphatase family protein [Micromonosporaceae bacterium]
MRLATFNVMHGRSLADGLVLPQRLRDSVAALDVEVLGLQEVDRGQPRSGHADLTAIAADALDAPYRRFVPALIGTPGGDYRPATDRDSDPGPGGAGASAQYGVALISRWPVLAWRVTRLPAAPVRSPIYVPGPGGGLLLLRDEPRVLLAAVVQAPFGRLTVATTHLSFVPGWNIRQLRTAVSVLGRLPAPRLLLGDLNLPAAMAGSASGWLRLARRATYPGQAPRVQLDHVLVDPRGVDRLPGVLGVATPLVSVSDHRPLVVQLAERG